MPHRYLCDVLEEIRKCNETRNYSYLLGLVEEAQTLANRMEAALGEKKDAEGWHKKAKEEKAEYEALLEKANKVRKELGEKEKKKERYV